MYIYINILHISLYIFVLTGGWHSIDHPLDVSLLCSALICPFLDSPTAKNAFEDMPSSGLRPKFSKTARQTPAHPKAHPKAPAQRKNAFRESNHSQTQHTNKLRPPKHKAAIQPFYEPQIKSNPKN